MASSGSFKSVSQKNRMLLRATLDDALWPLLTLKWPVMGVVRISRSQPVSFILSQGQRATTNSALLVPLSSPNLWKNWLEARTRKSWMGSSLRESRVVQILICGFGSVVIVEIP